MVLWFDLLKTLLLLTVSSCTALRVGVGIADVTGPAVEVTLMGYGNLEQQGSGIHLRQWSRAFIFDDNNNRFVFVNVDAGMMGDGVRREVIKTLQLKYGEVYNEDNVMLSATHTHSGVGGFLFNTLFDLPSFGFSRQTFDAFVSGIVKSIEKADARLQDAKLTLSRGKVMNANLNRSPTSYEANPEAEKSNYEHNTDRELTQLRITSVNGSPLGVINWFAVHPTSMNYTNTLVSSDNMGYASVLFEEAVNKGNIIGKGPFVAAFASSNLGDVSPNVLGPKCLSNGAECDANSKCESLFDPCFASGPGEDMFDSTRIIATRIFDVAWKLWLADAGEDIVAPVKSVHQYVHMPSATVTVPNATGGLQEVHGCLPAMGYSFAAGTIDGPFSAFINQGTTHGWAWLDVVRNKILAKPTAEDNDCHFPKPILLPTGRMNYPFEWQPHIVSTQLATFGNMAIVCAPGEFTTMAGRRLRNAVADVLFKDGGGHVVLAGLCNSYSDYITTYEEYQVQRYEGASTLFGPHTLSIYEHQYSNLARALTGDKLSRGPEPPGRPEDMVSFIKPVVFDTPGWFGTFGDVTEDVPESAVVGETISVSFVSGNPRNNLKLDDTYCTVEKLDQDSNWEVVATDANWETRFHWRRTLSVLGTSQVTIEWTIPRHTKPGVYRIRHFGHYKTVQGEIKPYEGTSRVIQDIETVEQYKNCNYVGFRGHSHYYYKDYLSCSTASLVHHHLDQTFRHGLLLASSVELEEFTGPESTENSGLAERVLEVFAGQDGHNRVAKVKLGGERVVTRPF